MNRGSHIWYRPVGVQVGTERADGPTLRYSSRASGGVAAAGATKKGGPPVRLAGPAPEANLDGRDERFRSGANQLPAVIDVHEVVFRGNPDDQRRRKIAKDVIEDTVLSASFQDDGVRPQALQVFGCVGDAGAQTRDFEIAHRPQQPGDPLPEERVDVEYRYT